MNSLKKKIHSVASSLFVLFATITPAFAQLDSSWQDAQNQVNRHNISFVNSNFGTYSSKYSFIVCKTQERDQDTYENYADAAEAARILSCMANLVNNPVAVKKYGFENVYYEALASYQLACGNVNKPQPARPHFNPYSNSRPPFVDAAISVTGEPGNTSQNTNSDPLAWEHAILNLEIAINCVDSAIPLHTDRNRRTKEKLNGLLKHARAASNNHSSTPNGENYNPYTAPQAPNGGNHQIDPAWYTPSVIPPAPHGEHTQIITPAYYNPYANL